MDDHERPEKRRGSDPPDATEPDEDKPAGQREEDEDRPSDDDVDEASKDSYPGSDAPAW